jgi:cytidine deaminase
MEDDRDWSLLHREAQNAAAAAYAPYSQFKVGAAVLGRSGAVFVGANIENASYGLSMCAERVAVSNAVRTEGATPDAITAAVSLDQEGHILSPCGACRQVILEFGRDAMIQLPSGIVSMQSALSDPFVLVDGPFAEPVSPLLRAPLHPRILKLLTMSDEDTILLLRTLQRLRRRAEEQWPKVKLASTRSILFVKTDPYLVVAPGFYSNLEKAEERLIRIAPLQGITGATYSLRKPNFGRPGSQGDLDADLLPPSEQQKVSGDLRWVVSWPLGAFGVVSLDGFDELSSGEMRDIAHSPALQDFVDLIRNVVGGT